MPLIRIKIPGVLAETEVETRATPEVGGRLWVRAVEGRSSWMLVEVVQCNMRLGGEVTEPETVWLVSQVAPGVGDALNPDDPSRAMLDDLAHTGGPLMPPPPSVGPTALISMGDGLILTYELYGVSSPAVPMEVWVRAVFGPGDARRLGRWGLVRIIGSRQKFEDKTQMYYVATEVTEPHQASPEPPPGVTWEALEQFRAAKKAVEAAKKRGRRSAVAPKAGSPTEAASDRRPPDKDAVGRVSEKDVDVLITEHKSARRDRHIEFE